MDAVVVGLGPGGAVAAASLARAGLRVEAYDPLRVYAKACGDATPADGVAGRLAEEAGVVVDEVRVFRILVGGREVAVVGHRRRAWVIMDKGRFVSYLRGLAEAEGAAVRYAPAPRSPPPGALYVDARGAYAGGPGRILVYRVIARAPGWPSGEAVMDFDVERLGFYWVFPAGSGKVNVGVGWLGCPECPGEARAAARAYASGRAGAVEVLDEKAAPLRVAGPVDPAPSRGRVAVGEAAGFVVSLSGEGIRQAVESGLALGEAARRCGGSSGCTVGEYLRLTRGLAGAARLSRRILELAAAAGPPALEGILGGLPESFWRGFLSGRMDLGLLAGALARRPGLALGLARLLLSSRS